MSDSHNNIPRRGKKLDDTSIPELFEFLKRYVQQETVDPLRGVGRWIAFGVGGALFLGLGLVFVLVGTMRLVQEEWARSATGSLSWLAYLITMLVAVALLALTVTRIKKSTLNRQPK